MERYEPLEVTYAYDGPDGRPILRRSSNQIVNSRRLTSIVDSVVDSVRHGTALPSQQIASQKIQKKYTMVRRQPATVVKCRYCNKVVKHPSKIAAHMRTHTGEKPFKCHICNQGFAQGHPLKVHIRNHLGEKPHPCRWECGKSFATTSQRQAHERVHTGEKIYFDCPVRECNVRYGKKFRIKEHVKEVHPEVDLEAVGLGGQPKKILINTIEQLIATVQEPEDVEEEELWPEDEQYYAAEDEQIDQPVVQYLDAPTPRRRYREPQQEDPPAYHYDPETGQYYEEQIVDANEAEEMMLAQQTQFLECEFIDPNDISLQPTVEEEVVTTEDPYEEIEMGDPPLVHPVYVPHHGASVTVATAAVASRRSARQAARSGGAVPLHARPRPVELTPSVMDGPMIADPRPPRRGRRKGAGNVEPVEAVEVDQSLVEMAAPKPPKSTKKFVGQIDVGQSRLSKPARNLDWIVDAVARGLDVDYASPHNRRKPVIHQCEVCGKIDKYPSKIKAHMRTHTGERPFVCEICGMGFAQRTAMRMHIRRHLNQKPYVCSFNCGARFINGALLNIHESTKHMGVKKYICMKGCGRSFAQRRNQMKHEETCRYGMGPSSADEGDNDEQHDAVQGQVMVDDVDVVGEEGVDDELGDEAEDGEASSADEQKRPLRVQHILISQGEAGNSKSVEPLFGLAALGPTDY
uniref:C2H2-type domain-containing protein n=1 Tax=Plectus sambesii TaxID=2011161 RepID=A0A914XPB2_9BILA